MLLFVVRHKKNIKYVSIRENELPDNRHEHILIDEIIVLTITKSKQKYSKRLLRIAIYDPINKQQIELITNQMSCSTNTIGEFYRAR